MNKYLLPSFLALALSAGSVSLAVAADPAADKIVPPAPAATTSPDQVIKRGTEDLQSLIKANHEKYTADMEGFYKVVDTNVVPYFDTKYIAQLILGRNWKDASPDQRMRFEVAFKNSLIRTYARALLTYYDTVNAEWQPVRAAAGATDVNVNCKLNRTNGPPVPLSFSMRLADGTWKVYDIVVENLSLITNFRSQMNSEIKANGLDKTIDKLEANQVRPAPVVN